MNLAASVLGVAGDPSFLGYDFNAGILVQGLIVGMGFGLLAVGFVLVYRASHFINFAQSAIGAFGAAAVAALVNGLGVPFWLAFPVGVVIGAALSGATEMLVVRRLARAPRVLGMVATLGLAQFLFISALLVNGQAASPFRYPQPPGFPSFEIDRYTVSSASSSLLVLAPLVVVGAALFLRYGRYGLALRAAAANPDAAALAGVSPSRMSTLAWTIAGGVAALSTTLVVPAIGTLFGTSLGPQLLLRGLAPAVIGRMRSIVVAFGSAVVLGVVEQVLLYNSTRDGMVDLVLFVVIASALLVQRRLVRREPDAGGWAVTAALRPLPDSLRHLPLVRALPWIVGAGALSVAVVIPPFRSEGDATDLTFVVAFAIVALSVTIVTGQAGQLSLGQFGFAAIGAVASFRVVDLTGSFLAGVAAAGIFGAVVAAVVGIPALRVRGLFLAVSTLAFALAVNSWLIRQPWVLGDLEGEDPGKPVLGGLELDSPKRFYFVALVVLVVCLGLARNVTRGGWGRSVRALRDNEDAARAFAVPARTRTLQAYAVAGLVAGLGGAVYGHAFSTVQASNFDANQLVPGLGDGSVGVVAIAVIGGIASLAGPLLGSLYVVGIPKLISLDVAGQAVLALGWLVVVLSHPNGLVSLLRPARDGLVDFIARRHGIDPVEARSSATAERPERGPLPVTAVPRSTRTGSESALLLEIHDVSKRYGGVHAVDGVTLCIRAGEAVGLIGPNGAGKTTLFELASGFARCDGGRIRFAGADVTRRSPEARGRLGLVRSFQDARLFPTLTVEETVMLAQERVTPSPLWQSVLAIPGPDRHRRARARDLLHLLGLGAVRDRPTGELPTGTRRLTELACLLAVEARMLLLDEPSAGIGQAETEALGELLRRVRDELGVTLLVIEHDMPLVGAISDRLVAMELGRIIADGPPDEVQRDPQVVEAYLGGDPAAIARSRAANQSVSG